MSKMIDGEKVIKAIKDGISDDWSMSAREAIEIIRKYEQPVSGDDNPRLEASFIADSISDYGKKQPVSGGVDEPAWILPDSLLKFLLGEADYHGIGFGEKGDNRGKYWWRNDLQKLRPYIKQPTPADETMRGALQLAIYEITHLCPEENDGSHRPIISKAVLTKLRQALAQPSKPAMTMS